MAHYSGMHDTRTETVTERFALRVSNADLGPTLVEDYATVEDAQAHLDRSPATGRVWDTVEIVKVVRTETVTIVVEQVRRVIP